MKGGSSSAHRLFSRLLLNSLIMSERKSRRASISSVLDRIQDSHRALIVDFSSVPLLDSTGANMIEGLAHSARKRGVALWLTGTSRDILRVFATHGLHPPLVHYAATVDEALAQVR